MHITAPVAYLPSMRPSLLALLFLAAPILACARKDAAPESTPSVSASDGSIVTAPVPSPDADPDDPMALCINSRCPAEVRACAVVSCWDAAIEVLECAEVAHKQVESLPFAPEKRHEAFNHLGDACLARTKWQARHPAPVQKATLALLACSIRQGCSALQ